MTSEEIRKLITEKRNSQITIGDMELTEYEKSIWIDGYCEGCVKCLECAAALIDEKFKTSSKSKGEENDK